jgi:hypothetical protein
VLHQLLETAIVDESSNKTALPIRPAGAGDSSITVEISGTGQPMTIGLTRASAWAEATKGAEVAVTQLGAGLSLAKTGLADLVAARASADTLPRSGTQQRIADLEQRKRLAEAEAAVTSEVSTRAAVTRKERLDAELAVLLARQPVRDALDVLDSD